ncbi:MAG: alpha/beta fold hydrolase [Myxococcaceae bacterium]
MALPHEPPAEFLEELGQVDLPLRAGTMRALWFRGGSTDPGRAVVCLAGMGATGRSFVRQRPLSREHFLLLVNLPSQTPSEENPLIHSAEAVEELVGRMVLEKPVLLGTSYGGAVAAQVAVRGRVPLSGLVLVDAILSRRQIPLASPAGVDLLEAPEPLARFFAPLAVQIMGGLRLDRAARDEIVREARDLSPSELKRRLLAVMRLDLLGPATALKLPTLVVHGARDLLVPWWRARWTAEAIPGARFELIPGAGHLPYLTDPERFNALLGSFLATIESGHPERRAEGP